jgi:hypothetical protein
MCLRCVVVAVIVMNRDKLRQNRNNHDMNRDNCRDHHNCCRNCCDFVTIRVTQKSTAFLSCFVTYRAKASLSLILLHCITHTYKFLLFINWLFYQLINSNIIFFRYDQWKILSVLGNLLYD